MPANRPPRPRIRKSDKSEMNVVLPQAVSDRLSHLANLPQDWDSYGGSPMSPKAIRRAELILKEALTIAKEVPPPFIAPANDGTVVLEWKTSTGKELILDIPLDDEPVSFLLVEPKKPEGEIETEGVIGKPWALAEVICRLQAK